MVRISWIWSPTEIASLLVCRSISVRPTRSKPIRGGRVLYPYALTVTSKTHSQSAVALMLLNHPNLIAQPFLQRWGFVVPCCHVAQAFKSCPKLPHNRKSRELGMYVLYCTRPAFPMTRRRRNMTTRRRCAALSELAVVFSATADSNNTECHLR